MRKTEILVLLVACLMFAIGMPSKTNKQELMARQEEQAEDGPMEIDSYNFEESQISEDDSYQVTHRSASAGENKIADIIWLKKAAQVALDAGVPYFNVLKQKTRKDKSLHVVEGEIELDNDPMASEYDANEIMSLVLTDRP